MKKPKSKREKIKETSKRTTARLIKEIAKSEGILAAIGDGVSIIDRTFKILYQNQAETDMMGDHLGEYCSKAYAKRQGICGGCPIAKTFKDGKIHTVQRKLKTDKEIRYAEITASPLKDPEGKIIAGIEVVRDITERKQMEEKLRESEKKFRLSFENAQDAILWANPKTGIIINCNKAAEILLEKPKEEIIGSHRRTLHPPHKLKEYDEDFKRHAMQKRPPDVELEVITKSGKIKTVLVSDTVTFIERKPIIQGIFHDITEKKLLETSIQHAKRLESIGTLAGGIANDFNNILTAIIGFGHILKTEMSEYNPLTIYVTRILSAAERAATLTRSLLAFSRTQIINPRPVDLNEIIKAIEYPLERLCGDNIKFSSFIADRDLIIMADTYQVEQVLINLVTNAKDAMQDRGSLIIRTERFDLDNKFIKTYGYGKPGPYAFLSIEDTGQGMDEETKARIFEPFFTTREIGKGTGLGLSMVYGTIKQHEGYINVYSELGKGTTFKIYLPLIDSKAKAVTEEVSAKINGGTEKILVAENDAEVREMIKDILRVSGYSVLEAENGEKAIEVFGENREAIQLLILDVFMPKKNGKEVFDEIRKARPDMKVIFISGYDINVIQKKGFLEEDIDFVSKPIFPDKFLQKVREVLDK